jgi:two-component system, OmpR family, copper resistance phosphate regulon response regulator CusR
MRVLIAEDDVPLANFLRQGLEAQNYAIDVCHDGEHALQMASTQEYDSVVLDLNPPQRDAISVLKQVRVNRASLPVIVLTARNRIEDRVACLDAGADDYLAKPFSFLELSARLRALMRRSHLPTSTLLSIGDLRLDRVERRVERSGRRIELTSKEFALLEYLMRNAGRHVTRDMIIEHVWNLSLSTGTTNVVDVYINYLRKKIDDGATPKLIHTLRGVGYELSCRTEACV